MATLVLGVFDVQIAWTSRQWISQIVECTAHGPAPGRLAPAFRTGTLPLVAVLPNNLGRRQVLDTCNALGCVRNVFSRSHRYDHFDTLQKVLLSLKLSANFTQDLRKNAVLML